MANTVGVLISRNIFRDCLRGRSPYESLVLYNDYGKQEGVKPVFFTIDHLLMRSFLVRGFELQEDGHFVQRMMPIPKIIHNRIKPSHPLPELKQLQQSPRFLLFNKDNRLDKWPVYQALVAHPALKPHLPVTYLLNQSNYEQMKERYSSVYMKPRNKSLGIGVRRLNFHEGGVQVTHAKGKQEKITPSKHSQWLKKLMREPLLIQQSIELIKVDDHPVDIRVAVQRGRNGEWQVSGMVARVGPVHGIATNVAVGGKAKLLLPTLQQAGIDRPESILPEIERVVLIAAEHLSKVTPGLADLGFDVAIDHGGHIWIIEVNGRDLRITFHQAKDLEAWKRTFEVPMQYAAYLYSVQADKQPNPPSIAIVTPGNLPVCARGSGSVEISAREIAREVSKQHPVYLFGKKVRPIGNVHPIEPPSSTRKGYLTEAIGSLRMLKPDIIQVENRPLWIGHIKKSRLPSKKILFLHSVTFIQPPYAKPAEVRKYLAEYDQILTNSQFMVRWLSQQFPDISGKIKAVRLGVDLQHFRSIHDEEVRKQRIQNRQRHHLIGCPVVLFVGRIIPKKGVHHLVDAFLRVHQQHPDAVLIMVGSSYYGKNIETPYVRNLKEKSKSLGDRIRWWPFTTHRKLPSIYQLADILVTPSIGREAFGLVNVEGMATGLPILTTRTGGISEVVKDGVNGCLLPVDNLTDELARVLGDWLHKPLYLKQMGKESRKRAEELFSWKRVAKDLSEIYQSI